MCQSGVIHPGLSSTGRTFPRKSKTFILHKRKQIKTQIMDLSNFYTGCIDLDIVRFFLCTEHAHRTSFLHN